MDLGLEGRTVIITGGSGGIGHGLVIGFAREGANVVSASRDVATGEKLAARAREQGCPGAVLPVATDVTDPSSVTARSRISTRQRVAGSSRSTSTVW